ncbi:MAG: CHASE domain-containing protein [Burkholderiaceae bacterium]
MNWLRGFPSIPAVIGFIAGTLLTFVLWRYADDIAQRERERAFTQRVSYARLALERVNAETLSQLQSARTLAELDSMNPQTFAGTVGADKQRQYASGLQYVAFLSAVEPAGGCTPFATDAPCLKSAMVFPLATNEALLSLDLPKTESRREAIRRAVDSGYVAMTQPLPFAADSIAQPGLLAFLPVYTQGAPLTSISARRRGLKGVAVASFSLEFLVRSELGRDFLESFEIVITDVGLVGSGRSTNYTPTVVMDSRLLRRTLAVDDGQSKERPTTNLTEITQEVAGRTWVMQFSSLQPLQSPWFTAGKLILLMGGLLTLLLTMFLHGLADARKRAEDLASRMTRNLRTREAQLHQALGAANMGAWHWDARTETFTSDTRAGALLALQKGPLTTLFTQIHRSDRRMAQQAFKSAASSGEPFLAECRLASRTEGVLWVELSARLVKNQAGNVIYVSGLVRDITERNELAAARRRLLHKLVNAEEKERRRIARELHDQLGQEITAIILGLRNLESIPADSPKRGELLSKLRGIVHDIDNRVDKFMLDLRPVVLDELGLEAALAAQFVQWTDLHNIPVNSHISGLNNVDLPFEVATTAFRVVQESLTNVAKHSGATSVDVIVELKHGKLKVVVEDNGLGIKGDRSPHSYGLAGLQERVESLGGSYRQESRPGQGFTIFVSVPATQETLRSEPILQVTP